MMGVKLLLVIIVIMYNQGSSASIIHQSECVEWTKLPGCEDEVSWTSWFGDLATTFFKGCKNFLYQTFVQPFSKAADEIRQAREEKIQRAADYMKEIKTSQIVRMGTKTSQIIGNKLHTTSTTKFITLSTTVTTAETNYQTTGGMNISNMIASDALAEFGDDVKVVWEEVKSATEQVEPE